MAFSKEQLNIIRFCAIECTLQVSGEESVHWMLNGYDFAYKRGQKSVPTVNDILELGKLIEPKKNALGFRRCAVWVGYDEKMEWEKIPAATVSLCENDGIPIHSTLLSPAQWFKAYEDIHPFVDGNGRTGAILYNWLSRTMDNPDWPPNFWNDSRRYPGWGAPLQ